MKLRQFIFAILIILPLFSISNGVFAQKNRDKKAISIVENFLTSQGAIEMVKNRTYFFDKIGEAFYEPKYKPDSYEEYHESDSIEIYDFGNGISEGGWCYLLFKYKKKDSFFIIGQYSTMYNNLSKLADVMEGIKSTDVELIKSCYNDIISNYGIKGNHVSNDLIVTDSIR